MTEATHETEASERDEVRASLGLEPRGSSLDLDGSVDEEGDGRTLRRTRNRQRVIIALLDIVREGELDPSVADIADRAGVSHRSVFRYFDDINDLVRTAIDHEVEQATPLSEIADLGMGSLDRRIDAWVDMRLSVNLATYQVLRVARHRAPGIPSIDEGMKVIYQLGATKMRNHFATELDQLGPDGGFVIDAATVLTSFEAFDLQKRIMEHNTERIRQVWHLGLHELFTRTPDRR
jgi:AcrR family transcriptional regulator